MTGEEPLNLKANGTLKLDRKSIKLRVLTHKSSSGTKRTENTWNSIRYPLVSSWEPGLHNNTLDLTADSPTC